MRSTTLIGITCVLLCGCYPAYQELGAARIDPSLSPQAPGINENLLACHDHLANLSLTAYKDRAKGSKLAQTLGVLTVLGGSTAGASSSDAPRWIGAGVAILSGIFGVFQKAISDPSSEQTQKRGEVLQLWGSAAQLAADYSNKASAELALASQKPAQGAPTGDLDSWQKRMADATQQRLQSEFSLRTVIASCSSQLQSKSGQ